MWQRRKGLMFMEQQHAAEKRVRSWGVEGLCSDAAVWEGLLPKIIQLFDLQTEFTHLLFKVQCIFLKGQRILINMYTYVITTTLKIQALSISPEAS